MHHAPGMRLRTQQNFPTMLLWNKHKLACQIVRRFCSMGYFQRIIRRFGKKRKTWNQGFEVGDMAEMLAELADTVFILLIVFVVLTVDIGFAGTVGK